MRTTITTTYQIILAEEGVSLPDVDIFLPEISHIPVREIITNLDTEGVEYDASKSKLLVRDLPGSHRGMLNPLCEQRLIDYLKEEPQEYTTGQEAGAALALHIVPVFNPHGMTVKMDLETRLSPQRISEGVADLTISATCRAQKVKQAVLAAVCSAYQATNQ